MSAVTRLILVRHAEPRAEARGRCYGRLDVGLSTRGLQHAGLLARALDRVPLAAIHSSPSRRALQTAAPLAAAQGLAPIVDGALREIDFGALEGRRYGEIARDHPDLYRRWMETPTRVRFPGGESYAELRARSLRAMEAILARHRGETAAVVSHGGVLRAMLAACLAMPDEAIFRLDQAHGAISIVDWVDAVPLVRLVNGRPATGARARRGLPPAAADQRRAEPRPMRGPGGPRG